MGSGNRVNNFDTIRSSRTIIPERLKEARIYRGLTQQDLANEIGLKRQAVCNYEVGTNNPPFDMLLCISKVLDFPVNFFYKEKIVCENQGEVYFRSSAIPSKKKEMLEQKLNYLASEIVYYLEKYLTLPEVNLIDVKYQEEYTKDDIKEIAKQLRIHWKLYDKPIQNLTHIMQENGCIIARLEFDTQKTDGYSKWMDKRPYTFLNIEKNVAARSRFTLAHELGHIVLHSHLKKGEDLKRREREANYFAGEFLFPSEAVINEISYVTLDSLLPLKAKWGISVGAITRRCLDLELITEERFTLLQKQISKRHWRINEPLDDVIKCETPRLFKEAFSLLVENSIILKSEIVNAILFSENELIKICCLGSDFFNEKIMSLKPKLEIVR